MVRQRNVAGVALCADNPKLQSTVWLKCIRKVAPHFRLCARIAVFTSTPKRSLEENSDKFTVLAELKLSISAAGKNAHEMHEEYCFHVTMVPDLTTKGVFPNCQA